jgi:hypothetical protein
VNCKVLLRGIREPLRAKQADRFCQILPLKRQPLGGALFDIVAQNLVPELRHDFNDAAIVNA